MNETMEAPVLADDSIADLMALIDGLLATTTRNLIPASEVQDFVLDMRNVLTSN